MEIEVRNTVIANWDIRQERQCPCEACSEDEVVNIGNGSAIGEMDRSGSITARDMRNWRTSLDLRVFEGFVAKVYVVFAAYDCVNR
jgi:hypothetical protein